MGELITASDGTFRFEGVEPGTWWIVSEHRKEGSDPHGAEDLAVTPSTAVVQARGETELVLEAVRALSLRGVVLGPSGEPLAGVEIAALRPSSLVRATTGADGAFVLSPLISGEWRLSATPRDRALAVRSMHVEAGAEHFIVNLGHAGAIRGSVSDTSGSPTFLECRIHVARIGGDGSTGAMTQCGEFELDQLEPGRYALLAEDHDAGVAFAEVEVRAGPAPVTVDLVLERCARVALRNPGHEAIAEVRLRLGKCPIALMMLLPGDRTSLLVPPRAIELDVRRNGKFVRLRTVRPGAGEELEVVLDG